MPKATPKAATVEQQLPLAPNLLERPQRLLKIERNVNSLGFFSSTNRPTELSEKTIRIRRTLPGGGHQEATATIFSMGSRGLPTTADQDKYLAFHILVNDIRKRQGAVSNPIAFSTYQLLRILGQTPNSDRYRDIQDWLERMAGTAIRSENAVYLARQKRYVREVFHLFDKVATAGSVLQDGTVTERNLVWLSVWQLENINSGYLLQIDYERYHRLKTRTAKAMVPLLYLWLNRAQKYERRYSDLMQHLGIRAYRQISKATEKLAPGLNELIHEGFLESWTLTNTVDRRDFKLQITVGPAFLDRDEKAGTIVDVLFERRVKMLTDRGISEKQARRLLLQLPEGNIERTVEWIDTLIAAQPAKFTNPPGFLIAMLRDGAQPSVDFVSSEQREKLYSAAAERDEEYRKRACLELEYNQYRQTQLTRYLDSLDADIRTQLLKRLNKRVSEQYPMVSAEQRKDLAFQLALREVESEVNLLTFDEFACRDQPLLLSLEGQ